MNGIAQHAYEHRFTDFLRQGVRLPLMTLVKSRRGMAGLVVLADFLAVLASVWLLWVFAVNLLGDFNLPPIPPIEPMVMIGFFWLAVFWFAGAYVSVHNRSLFEEYYSALKILVFGFFIVVGILYIAVAQAPGSRSYRLQVLLVWFVLLSVFVGAARTLVRVVVRRLRKRGIGLYRTIIVGESVRSQQLLEMFTAAPELGYSIIGTVRSNGAPTSPEFSRLILGDVTQLDDIINAHRVDVTVLAMDRERDRDVVPRLMAETCVADTTIKIVPDLYDLLSGQARAQHLYGVPLIEINPQIMPAWQQHMKRLLDIGFSLFIFLLGLPAWLVVSVLIKLEDGGPVLYAQERVGLGGRKFMMYKFRSMRTDAERSGISWTAVNDPRVTRVGRIIRRLHIDEIPQFWNVLVGDMSIVGPRPERQPYIEKFTSMLPAYPRRLRVKPGVTGWNQVHMAEVVETVEFLQERLRHDFFYIENLSLRLDIEIIFRTIIRVLQRKGQA